MDESEFLDHILLLLEDPDDGWVRRVNEWGTVYLDHVPSNVLLHVTSNGTVSLIVPDEHVDKESVISGGVRGHSWKPGGWNSWSRRRRLRRSVQRCMRFLILRPVREAMESGMGEVTRSDVERWEAADTEVCDDLDMDFED